MFAWIELVQVCNCTSERQKAMIKDTTLFYADCSRDSKLYKMIGKLTIGQVPRSNYISCFILKFSIILNVYYDLKRPKQPKKIF